MVHGLDGLDEISTSAPTQVSELVDGQIRSYMIEPGEYGIPTADHAAISGGSPAENAEIINNILQGERGAKRDLVLLNTAAALVVAGKAENIREGLKLAADSIDSGAALGKLDRLRELSRQQSC